MQVPYMPDGVLVVPVVTVGHLAGVFFFFSAFTFS